MPGASAVVGGGMILHALNTFIVATILPSVVRDIGGLRYFAWSTVLYVVASLLGGAVCARLLQRIGARGAYRLALGGFAAGVVACALAPSMPVLLAGRFVQGLGAGTLSALSFTMVRTLFPSRLWPRALSVVSVAWGVATLLGPAVGGVFAQYGVWRAAFWTVGAAAPLLLLRSSCRCRAAIASARRRRAGACRSAICCCWPAACWRSRRAACRRSRLVNAAGLVAALAGIRAVRPAGGGRAAARLFPVGATSPALAARRHLCRDDPAAGRHHAGDLRAVLPADPARADPAARRATSRR